jgi:hypothetical protein
MAQTDRKELVTNDLAKGLTSAYEGLKKGPSRGTIIFLAVVLAVVLLSILGYWWRASSRTTESKRWQVFDGAVFPSEIVDSLEEKDLQGSNQLTALRFQNARMKLSEGVREMGDPSTRKKGREKVGEARDTYVELSKKSTSLSPVLNQEALWGAAKAYEALGHSDDLDEAIKLYEKLRKEYPSSAMGKDAKKQLQRLNDKETRQKIIELTKQLDEAK